MYILHLLLYFKIKAVSLMKIIALSLFLLAIAIPGYSQDVYTVKTKEMKGNISPTLWGLFFEDINRGADGGLYAELVKNPSFDFPKPMTGWEAKPRRMRDGIFIIT